MANCWAACLGDCDGGMSREHMVSKCLFNSPGVTIQGLPWCKDEAKTVGLESLTAKILCQAHNSRLSPLDAEAGLAFDALRKLSEKGKHGAQRSPLARLATPPHVVDARLLERWLLKTLLNLSRGSDLFIGTTGIERGVPPNDLVEICYGKIPFEGSAGMYVAANKGMVVNLAETLQFSPLLKDDRIFGGFFEFQGIRIFLALTPQGLQFPLSSIPGLAEGWRDADLMWRFSAIQTQISKLVFLPEIKFQW